MSPNQVIINLDAIRHNFRRIKALSDPRGVIAVVKSDAYGHGMIEVARTLEPEGPAYFAVFELDEAVKLKQAGCKRPILILMGPRRDDIPTVVSSGFTVCLFREEIARTLSEQAVAAGLVVPVHIKVDTGMSRLGVNWTALPRFLEQVVSLKGIRVDGLFSHLAASDEPDNSFTDTQRRRLASAVEAAQAMKIPPEQIHVSNSGAVLNGQEEPWGFVRPGLALYGSAPCPALEAKLALKPAMTFASEIIQVKQVPPETPISYGCTYTTPGPATIATIPAGYDDGYNRLLSNRGEVLIRGRRAPVVGRVCMNLTMVDVSHISEVSVGDEVVLLGRQGAEQITAEEIASKIDSISYEVYCTVGKSNSRHYVSKPE